MIEAQFFGGAVLTEGGRPVSGRGNRRHPLALLALLVVAPFHTLTRLKAIGLLWPHVDEARGRNRMTSTLYQLRQTLGKDVVQSVSAGLRLDPEGLTSDVWRFRDALDRGDAAGAVEIYRGPFLDGFYLEDAPGFEERVELERHRLHRAWSEAVLELAQTAGDEGRHGDSVRWWRSLAAADPLDSSIAAGLISALADAGNRGGAIRAAEEHSRRLLEEFNVEPEPGFRAIVERLQSDPAGSANSPPPAAAGRPVHGVDPRPTVAVLPFETLTGHAESPLAEGVHSGILTRLSEIAGLSVIARSSVRRFRETNQPAAAIGAELGARWILEGDVQTGGGSFRVNVRLVEAPEDRQLWGRTWEGQLSGTSYFRVQTEIAREVVESLPLSPSAGEQLALSRQPPEDLEAHRLCAEGQMRLDLRNEAGMERALQCFERALELAPDSARARVGMANALGLLHAYGLRDASILPRAETAIREALEVDPHSAEAHAAFGRLLGQRREEQAARQHIRRAVELQPSYAEAHNWASVGHTIGGRPRKALRSAQRAVALNPLSPEAVYNLGMALLINGKLEDAVDEARRTRTLEPTYDSGRLLEALALYELERYTEAAAVVEGVKIPWAGPAPRTIFALCQAAEGRPDEVRPLLDELESGAHSFDQGLVLGALGEREIALEALARSRFDGFDFAVTYWPTVAIRYLFANVWDRLRDDPRYEALVRRMDRSWGLA